LKIIVGLTSLCALYPSVLNALAVVVVKLHDFSDEVLFERGAFDFGLMKKRLNGRVTCFGELV
jgi:hypothetical protein